MATRLIVACPNRQLEAEAATEAATTPGSSTAASVGRGRSRQEERSGIAVATQAEPMDLISVLTGSLPKQGSKCYRTLLVTYSFKTDLQEQENTKKGLMSSAPGDQWNDENEYVFQYFQSLRLLIAGMRRVECSFLENTCVGCSEFLWQEEMYQSCVKVLNLCSLAGVRELRWMKVFV